MELFTGYKPIPLRATKPDIPYDIISEAKSAARGKSYLIDIKKYGHCYYAHGFARQGPWNIKTGEELSPDPTTILPEVDRLKKIFQYGLIAESFARRINKPISRNWSDPANLKHVSLVGLYQGVDDAISLAKAAAMGNYSIFFEYPPGSFWTILIDPNLAIHGEDAIDECYFRKFRIPQRSFIGIAGENIRNSPQAVEDVTNIMLSAYANKPELAIPIYDIRGDTLTLMWPK